MTHFHTSRHFINFYLVLFLMLLLVEGFGLKMIHDFYRAWGMPDFKVGLYLFLFMGCLQVLFGLFFLVMYIRNAPIIVLEKDRIIIGKETYFLNEVSQLQLTGKYPFGWGISLPYEGACITLKDGKKKYIFDSMYANGAQLKMLLERKINKTPPPITAKIRNFRMLQFKDLELYKGNPLINFRAAMLWLIIGFFLWNLVFDPTIHRDAFIFMAGLGVIWSLLLGLVYHYFGLTGEYFVVSNHIFFWKRHVYLLGGIKEIVLESHGKGPNSLRLISEDYQTKIYAASTLKDKTWLKLKEALEKMEVPVRNEAIPERA